MDQAEASGSGGDDRDLWEETSSEASAASVPSDGNEFYPLAGVRPGPQGLLYTSPLFPLLHNEVASARRHIQTSVEQAMGHCRRDNLWRRLFHGEYVALDKLKLAKLSFTELEELLQAVQSRSVGEIDPQLVRILPLRSLTWLKLIFTEGHMSVTVALTVAVVNNFNLSCLTFKCKTSRSSSHC